MPDNSPAENFQPPDRIFLTGYMGAGKTTVGKQLADKLGYRFVDTDSAIAKRFQKKMSRIFEEHGEAEFRETEKSVLAELSSQKGVVISTGGGTLAREETLSIALASGTVVYLKAPVDLLFERVIFSHKDRPLINVPNPEEAFAERFEARRPFYERAQIHVETTNVKAGVIVEAILQQLKAMPAENFEECCFD